MRHRIIAVCPRLGIFYFACHDSSGSSSGEVGDRNGGNKNGAGIYLDDDGDEWGDDGDTGGPASSSLSGLGAARAVANAASQARRRIDQSARRCGDVEIAADPETKRRVGPRRGGYTVKSRCNNLELFCKIQAQGLARLSFSGRRLRL